ncbi:alpha/beta hydrolase family protein [Ekhidna sp.]|uniref:alpha/beta hydrolase family protein n=1 Tax=Ekhidna sp. TaxID=2608089 RepID=UPI003BAD61C6
MKYSVTLLLISIIILSCGDDDGIVASFIPIDATEAVLAAELDLPNGDGPFPAMIMVHGSGHVDRHLFKGSAQNYVRLGIAVLRYDKRGVGQSTGRYHDVNAANSPTVFPILADDVNSIVKYLTTRPDILPDHIGLIGPSQAGWIMPLAAGSSSDISFMVSVSGATSTVGISDYFDSIAEGNMTEEEIAEALKNFNGIHGFDPRPSLESLQIPALWVYGGKDKSNPAANDISIIEDIRETYDKDYTVHLFPNLNHELLDVNTNAPIPETQICVNDWLELKLGLSEN